MLCVLFLIYRIQVRYGKEWAPAQPSVGSNTKKHSIEFKENEYLTHIYASVGDVGVFNNVILDIEVHTNTRVYGSLVRTPPYFSIDIQSEKAFFTGYVRTIDGISFVSGIKLVLPTCSGTIFVMVGCSHMGVYKISVRHFVYTKTNR